MSSSRTFADQREFYRDSGREGQIARTLLEKSDVRPVLIDIGASGGFPEIWEEIAGLSTFIGFDPDLRDIKEISDGRFRRSVMVNKAVTADDVEEVTFHLTRNPHCSSTLEPDMSAVGNYAFAESFIVERQITAGAATIRAVLDQFDLPCLDWIKLDLQGTDLRLFRSVPAKVRSMVLAVDVEPGLIDAYKDDDGFIDAHKYLTSQGFWLSDAWIDGVVRLRKTTSDLLAAKGIGELYVNRTVRPSPGWGESRYLRTVESLAQSEAPPRSYALLWAFSCLDGQYGFALDVAGEYRRRFGSDESVAQMESGPIELIQLAESVRLRKRWLPKNLMQRLQRARTKPTA